MEYKKEDFPKRAIYRKPENRIPFLTDFEDGEEVEFYYFANRPAAISEGLAFYKSSKLDKNWKYNLVNIRELEPIE